jgi:hypothetical protein
MARTTLLLFFCIISLQLSAQNLTGRWVGSFIANNDALINSYSYQIDIKENSNHQITAQTITQKADQFYASAFARGSHSLHTNLVQINETSFDQVKIASELEACLMTNFLTYKNMDGHELLEGTYMSNAVNGKRNCGSGKVFLEKAENLLSIQKKKNNLKSTDLIIPPIVESKKSIAKLSTPNVNSTKPIVNNPKPIIKVQSNPIAETDTDEVIVENITEQTKQNTQHSIQNQPINLPWVLVGRENKLVKKIITNSKKISIDLFDNGTIDNDTVIVYDNKQLLVNKQRLSYKSIHLEFNFTENIKEHEVIIVAHNMGTVPPNTALLLYKDGKNRQEYFITSTNKINAKLLIVYEPPAIN